MSRSFPTASGQEVTRRVTALLREHRLRTAGVVVLSAISTVAALAGPVLIGTVVDAVASGAPDARSTVSTAAVAFAVVAIISGVVTYATRVLAAAVGEDVLAALRSEVFDHAVSLPSEVVEEAGTGDLVSRVTGDVAILARAVRLTVPVVLVATAEIVLTAIAIAVVDVSLALTALVAAVPVGALGVGWYLRRAPERYRAERERHAQLVGALHEAYLGRDVIGTHRASERFRTRLAHLGRGVVDAELRTTTARNVLHPSVTLAQATGLVAVIAVGTGLVGSSSAPVGEVTAVALYLVRLFEPIRRVLEQIDQVQQSSAALARLVGVTRIRVPTPWRRPGVNESRRVSRRNGVGVEVARATFGYERDEPVLRDVELRVEAGERVVIVGPSGAGKTTLAKMIAGAHRPWSGVVRLGDQPITDLDRDELTSTVALVAQEGHVFARSVADNVRLANPDASDQEVRTALTTVGADRWVDALPAGVDTMVGAGHHRLTAPEAQQLGLARLVCADPAVVVLDEATADLDPAAAARTERHLETALAGRTVVTVAHRLRVAERADRVIVMEGGVIVADGSHAELAHAGGLYTDLWRTWSEARGNASDGHDDATT
ncbi:MAG: ABC transporter ATP-binding protein [Actinomycetota bacterium]|nr:ABC transporter ATP-binding protein [Actinomycetota bacterium]